jgi:hypothetical protein
MKSTPMQNIGGFFERRISTWILMSFAAKKGFRSPGRKKSQTAMVVGEPAAGMIAVLATFEVTEVRPLIDFGQDWEKTI